jgi:multiple sugar transport system substrate-binding protein
LNVKLGFSTEDRTRQRRHLRGVDNHRAACTRRQFFAGTVAGNSALLAAACGIGRAGDEKPAGERKTVTITYMSLGAAASDRVQQEQALFDTYNREDHGVTVTIEATGAPSWAGLKEKFIIRATGGDPADLVMNNWGTWADMSDGGMLTELTALLKRDKIGHDLFIPSSIESHSIDSKLWGMPVSMSVDALAYNVDLLEAAGLQRPPVNPDDKTWTMEKFLEYAQKMTRADQQFGFGGSYTGFGTVGVADGTYFGQLAWDDKQKKALMDTPNFHKGLQYWLDLATRYHVQPDAQEQQAIRGGITGNIFLTGKIGMQVTLAPFPREQTPFRWALATLPYSGMGRNISSRMWATALHAGRTQRVEQAWDFLKWIVKPENGGRFPLVAGHSVSPLVKGGSDIAQKRRQEESGVDPKAWLLQAQHSPVSASGMLKYANWPKAVEELTPKYNDFKAQRIGTTEYARTATEAIDRILGVRR